MDTKDIVMSDELRDKLKGFISFDVKNTFKYVPEVYRKEDIPKEYWPVYTLKSKNGIEVTESENDVGYVSIGDTSKYVTQSGTLKLNTLRKGIVEVKNQLHEDGTKINFNSKTGVIEIVKEDGNVSKKNTNIDGFIKLIPSELQNELVNAINERTNLTKEELEGLE